LSGAEIGRPKYRRSNPIIDGRLYQYRQPLHDVYQVTVNTALIVQTLFTVPIGQAFTPTGGAAKVKTIWDTNLVQSGLLPAPEKMFAKSISFSVNPLALLNDAARFLFDAFVTFNISQRPFLQTHIWKAPGGGGVWNGGSAAVVQNGWPSRDNQFAFVGELGETIEQQQQFSVVIDPTQAIKANATGTLTTATAANGGIGIDCFCHIDGLLNREIL
jgi:hypothetical protein